LSFTVQNKIQFNGEAMKKFVFGVIVVALLFSLLFTQPASPVSATGTGEGNWVLPDAASGTTYTTVDIGKDAETAPSWVRLFSDGITISSPTKICYSFRRGAFHWVPKFMQLKKGNWVSITSKIEYLNGNESGASACAQPIEAGTYALFAYYNGPQEYFSEAGTSFTVGEWIMTVSGNSLTDLYANKVNWQDYPTATQLTYGIKKCVNILGGCKEASYGQTDISGAGFTYPQNYNVTILSGALMALSIPKSGLICETKPYIKLLDKDNNILAAIYYDSEYSTRCSAW
jgi:hypothetical protein